MSARRAELAAGVAAGAVFIYAAAAKLADPGVFADAIHAYRLLPAWSIDSVALALPIFELLLGAGLILGWRRRELAGLAAMLLAAFTAALISARARGLEIDCGCFGPDAWKAIRAIPPLVRDGVLLALCAWLRWAAARRV